jgi:hypothetical protein
MEETIFKFQGAPYTQTQQNTNFTKRLHRDYALILNNRIRFQLNTASILKIESLSYSDVGHKKDRLYT